MISEVVDIVNIRSNGRPIQSRQLLVCCDHCARTWYRRYLNTYVAQDHHFCSHACRNLSPYVREKVKQTNLARYGVEFSAQSDTIKSRTQSTMLMRYGVPLATDLPQFKRAQNTATARRKSHATKCRNGSYRRSRVEIDLGDALSTVTVVKCQDFIRPKFSVDFYLPRFACYLQLDGVFWHGLDGTTINGTCRRIVDGKYRIDRELDSKTIESRIRLIRVTDVWYKENRNDAVQVLLELLQQKDWVGVRYFGAHFDHLR